MVATAENKEIPFPIGVSTTASVFIFWNSLLVLQQLPKLT